MNKPEIPKQEIEQRAIHWLSVLRSSSMTPQQQQQFFDWLQHDPEHQKAFIAVDELWQRGGALSRVSAPEPFYRKFFQFSPRVWYGMGISALCVMSVLMLFVMPSQLDTNEHFQTAMGERKEINLSDGSVITLNVNSEVEVNLESPTSREVLLQRGEVFFKVARDKSRPFSVHTSDGLVQVLGTQFSVRKQASATQVTVVSGLVQVEANAHDRSKKIAPIQLTANQQSELDENGVSLKNVDAKKVLAWRDGVLRFEGSTLSAVAEELSRYYGVKIVPADEQVAALRVVAVLSLAQGLQDNLDYLKKNLHLNAVTDPETEVVRLVLVR